MTTDIHKISTGSDLSVQWQVHLFRSTSASVPVVFTVVFPCFFQSDPAHSACVPGPIHYSATSENESRHGHGTKLE